MSIRTANSTGARAQVMGPWVLRQFCPPKVTSLPGCPGRDRKTYIMWVMRVLWVLCMMLTRGLIEGHGDMVISLCSMVIIWKSDSEAGIDVTCELTLPKNERKVLMSSHVHIQVNNTSTLRLFSCTCDSVSHHLSLMIDPLV